MRIAFDMETKDPDEARAPCLLASRLALGTRPSCEALHDLRAACAGGRASR